MLKEVEKFMSYSPIFFCIESLKIWFMGEFKKVQNESNVYWSITEKFFFDLKNFEYIFRRDSNLILEFFFYFQVRQWTN
jgi:hypothetical protein